MVRGPLVNARRGWRRQIYVRFDIIENGDSDRRIGSAGHAKHENAVPSGVGYECHDEGDGSRRIVYLASDLGGLPIYESIAYPDTSLVIYESSAAEVPASFPDALLELPRGVRFERFPPTAAK